MIGSKLFVVSLAVTTAISVVSANDLAAGLGALAGGLAGGLSGNGGLGGNLANPLGGNLGNTLAGNVQGLGDLLGGKKFGENSKVIPTQSQDKTEIKGSTEVAKKDKGGFFGIKRPEELISILLNPFELVAFISDQFKLQFDKFFPLATKGINFGLELVVQPFVLSLKIIEKVFVPDNCKLRFVCGLARTFSFTKDIIPKLSDKTLSESKVFKALCDGIHGDCDSTYKCDGQPTIKEEFKGNQKGNQKEEDRKDDDRKHHERKDHDRKNDEHQDDENKHEGHHEGYHEEPNYSASNILKSLKLKN